VVYRKGLHQLLERATLPARACAVAARFPL